MNKVVLGQAQGATPPNHFAMRTFSLFGKQDGDLGLSLSYYLPGGGVDMGPQPVEVIFYVLEGELCVQGEQEQHQLSQGEAIHISAGERKAVRNNKNVPAHVLVIANLTNLTT